VVKGFIRWCVSSTTGRLSEGKQPTVRTIKAWAERFFRGFKESTKTEVPEKDRKEVYDVGSSFLYHQHTTNSTLP
jgi:hypothetical protein